MNRSRKLVLRTQTIRTLTNETLSRVVGGVEPGDATGFIMRDTVIIRTGNPFVPGATEGGR
jgi:hypothetical protein